MKKILSFIAIIAFIGALAAPVYAADTNNTVITQVQDEKPKKSEAKKDTKKTSDCATHKAEAKKEGCQTEKPKSCGDKDKE